MASRQGSANLRMTINRRRPLDSKRANKDYYKGSRQAALGGYRTGAPGFHLRRGKGYRLNDYRVRVYVAPDVEVLNGTSLRAYVASNVNCSKRALGLKEGSWPGPGALTPETLLQRSRQYAIEQDMKDKSEMQRAVSALRGEPVEDSSIVRKGKPRGARTKLGILERVMGASLFKRKDDSAKTVPLSENAEANADEPVTESPEPISSPKQTGKTYTAPPNLELVRTVPSSLSPSPSSESSSTLSPSGSASTPSPQNAIYNRTGDARRPGSLKTLKSRSLDAVSASPTSISGRTTMRKRSRAERLELSSGVSRFGWIGEEGYREQVLKEKTKERDAA